MVEEGPPDIIFKNPKNERTLTRTQNFLRKYLESQLSERHDYAKTL